ncbi:MAG: pyridoxamine 5'-phosphate oxidase family protein [Holdemania massiliensis]
MQKVIQFLNENPVQYLATIGRDGKAVPSLYVRRRESGKLWFCTNNTKDVYQDMLANPYIEISVSAQPTRGFVCMAQRCLRIIMKEEMCLQNPIVKGQYQTADNPIFTVFYLADAQAVIADFSGNPPQEFTL